MVGWCLGNAGACGGAAIGPQPPDRHRFSLLHPCAHRFGTRGQLFWRERTGRVRPIFWKPSRFWPPDAACAACNLPKRRAGEVTVTGRSPQRSGRRQALETDVSTGRLSDLDGRDRRVMQIDGAEVRSQTALAERLWLVWLTPQMDRLFLDGPSARRRFLDRLVYAFDPAHAGRVTAYEQAMRERSRLLSGGGADSAWLTALESQMAERGVAIAVARRLMVTELAGILHEPLSPSFPMVDLSVTGTVEDWLSVSPALAVEDRIRQALAASRRDDADAGTTSIGPHRSDIRVRHSGKDMEAEQCSTGEQKALLLSLILAHTQRVAAHRGAAPILLLDEVVAHLERNAARGAFRRDMFASSSSVVDRDGHRSFCAFG